MKSFCICVLWGLAWLLSIVLIGLLFIGIIWVNSYALNHNKWLLLIDAPFAIGALAAIGSFIREDFDCE
jgi:hypothetical protein